MSSETWHGSAQCKHGTQPPQRCIRGCAEDKAVHFEMATGIGVFDWEMACGAQSGDRTDDLDEVTCPVCRLRTKDGRRDNAGSKHEG